MGAKFDALFKAFKESPTAAIMSLLVIAISVMFTINQRTNESIKDDLRKANKECATANFVQGAEMKQLRSQNIETFGLLKELQGQINTLKALGKIP